MDFARVEAEFRRLKAQFEKGSLAEADLKAQLEELMIEDEQGRWWVIGYKTGEWYVHDGEKWVQQELPTAAAKAAPPRPSTTGLPVKPQPRPTRTIPSTVMELRLRRDTVPVVLIAAGWLVCLVLWIIAGTSTYYLPWVSIAVLGSTGALITGLVLRRTDPPTPWRQVPVVAFGWAAGIAITWSLWAPYSTPRWALNAVIVALAGALITLAALKWTHPSLHWKHVSLVTLGWAIGCAIGGIIGWVVFWLRTHDASYLALVYALWIGTSGTAGSWLAFWLLRDKLPGSP
jgi:hypothetical protein